MIQDILTYSIVIWAMGKLLLGTYRLFKPKYGQSACASGHCGCEAKDDLFKAIKKGKYPTLVK